MLRAIYRTIVLACFAFWFGGFGFYVSIVVPIGTEILGSARDQGAITQQVSDWLNVFGGIALAAMVVESMTSWKSGRRGRNITLLISNLIFAACLIILVWLHPMMDQMFDASDLSITDEVKFYNLHRIYLWGSTVQWFAAWAWLIGWNATQKLIQVL